MLFETQGSADAMVVAAVKVEAEAEVEGVAASTTSAVGMATPEVPDLTL